jgi:hypothetical protein
MTGPLWLPPLVLLENYRGDWSQYLEAVYDYFRQDFLGPRPLFRNKRMGLKRHPLIDGKEATFWHMITEGKNEAERIPDLRRCERIRWIMPIIQHADDACIKNWTQDIRGSTRTHLWLAEYEFLVVLDERQEFVLPWTAFPVPEERRKRYFQEQYERHRKS